MAKVVKRKKAVPLLPVPEPAPGVPSDLKDPNLHPFKPSFSVLLLLPLWLAFCAFMLTFPSYGWLMPEIQKHVPFQHSFWAPFILFVGMIGVFRLMPVKEEEGDMSSRTARFWLFLCLAFGAYMRLYHYSSPPAAIWDDNVYVINRARYIVDTGHYSGNFIFPVGVLPAVPYVSVFLWNLFPDLHSLTMQRLTGTLFDLGVIWFLYLAGKEIAGRRVGVLAAVLGVVSKALIQKCFTGYTDHSCVAFSLALAVLFTVRVMKKPDLSHFLQWGVIVGLGAYTTSQYIVFVPFLLFWMLGFLLLQKVPRGSRKPKPIVWVTAPLLLIYYIYYCGGFPSGNYITWFVNFAGAWMPCMVLAVYLVWAVYHFYKMASDQKNEKWTGWVAAGWVCTILSFPVFTSNAVFGQVKGNLLNTGRGYLNPSFILQFFKRLGQTFDGLFWGARDRGDMSLTPDSFFGYSEAVLLMLGLAFCLAKPNPKRILLGLLVLTGVVSYNVAVAPHSGYLVGCVTPCLLVGALGLNQMLTGLSGLSQSRVLRGLVLAVLLGFWGWTAQGVLSRVYDQYGTRTIPRNCIVYPSIMNDFNSGVHVFFDTESVSNNAADVVYEGHQILPWSKNAPNLVYQGSNETPKDIVLYAFPPAKELKESVEKAYPSAQWTEIIPPGEKEVYLMRCLIPNSAVSPEELTPRRKSKKSPPLIEFRNIPAPYWTRLYANYNSSFLFTRLIWEDKTANVNDPTALLFPAPPVVRYSGVIHVDKAGDYEFVCKTNKRTKVRVDGSGILNLFFPWSGMGDSPEITRNKTVGLKAGDHQVEVTSFLQSGNDAPEITLHPKGSPALPKSLWSSFNF
jgi:hypothetical protein